MPSYTKVIKRRVIQSPKFYYFDIAIPNHLLHRVPLQQGTDIYGHALEHLVIQELRAFLSYRHPFKSLSYWHTIDNRYEVDAILGDAEVAIEVKSSHNIKLHDTRGLKAFAEEYPDAKLYLISMEDKPRKFNGVEVWPVEQFFQRLWEGKVI